MTPTITRTKTDLAIAVVVRRGTIMFLSGVRARACPSQTDHHFAGLRVDGVPELAEFAPDAIRSTTG